MLLGISFSVAMVLILGYFTFVHLFSRHRTATSHLPLPPGPRKLPFIGNLLNFPSSFEWEAFEAWGKKYNTPIIHLSVAGRSLIVLNTAEAARDLLEKRSAIYSGRPNLRVINEFMGFGWLLVFMPYGLEWKERRRLFTRHFHPTNNELHKGKVLQCGRRLLVQLLSSPQDYMQHVRHSVGGMLISVAYGVETKANNDPYINVAEEVTNHISDGANTATMIIDVVPFLMPILSRILPLSTFQKSRSEWKELAYKFRDEPFYKAQRSFEDGAGQDSFVSRALEDGNMFSSSNTLQDEIIKDVAAIVFIGGSSTVNAIIHTFFLAMLCYPDAQRKAQEELDRVIGRGRLPDFTDQPQLPYLSALVKEIHRWRPSGPMAIPHLLEKDDEYLGYHIPAQSVVIVNVWAMLHDPQTYPDPEAFKPERFLKPDGTLDMSVRDPATVAFGFGRRICPGAHIAEFTFWIVVASVLSTFNISEALDEKGQEIEPTMEYRSAVTFEPMSFKCKIEPRHEGVKTLIQGAME
ncbi:hypothetical protein D9613_008357 [Agrocybe pediades]|uniref:Cytochrome P450 n=1 Tax=Agrocybe pediades TaxID=84607 RepID=A0A8H4VNM9_9AGAR|nr:hypothetical protein D9613_008357 [Agrocybe pediades]